MCARTGNPIVEDHPEDISLAKFKQYFPVEFIKQLEIVKFTGNFGDPAMAKECVEIHEYVDSINPNVHMAIHTNGGLRDRKFWQRLGEVYRKGADTGAKRVMIFHIDGLEDTNHLYRVNVDYAVVMKNARTAISTGARCFWAFIPFAHNEHQIELARQTSKDNGFELFMVKVSARFDQSSRVSFIDRKTGGEKIIQPAASDTLKVDALWTTLDVPVCSSEARKEIYINSHGQMFPCCWYASRYEKDDGFKRELAVHTDPNLDERNVYEILDDPLYNGAIQQSWNQRTIGSTMCHNKCRGKNMHHWIIDGHAFTHEQIKDGISSGLLDG